MNKTAFILSLFSLATGVSFAEETLQSGTNVSDQLDTQDESKNLSETEEQKEEQTADQDRNASKEQMADADDYDNEDFKPTSVKSNADDDSAGEENADTQSGSTGTEIEDKKEEPVPNNIDLHTTGADPEKKAEEESVAAQPKKMKKKKRRKSMSRHTHPTPVTSPKGIEAARNQTDMHTQGCPTSPDSEAMAVVDEDTCTT